jgi:mitogen-activated protein kinase kinase kinase
VIDWLAQHGFSEHWQDTFRELDLHGNQFLDIGRGHGNRGNVAMMHQVIFPQLQDMQGNKYDSGKEREEGKRLRKLVRKLVEQGPTAILSLDPHRRGPSLPSAGTESTLENSPGIGAGFNSTPTTAGTGQDSPGRFNHDMQSPTSAGWSKRQSNQRLPTISQGPPQDYVTETSRSPYSQDALRNFDSKSHGRTTSREALQEPGRHTSPQQSPGLAAATPVHQPSSATSTGTRFYANNTAHYRELSTESLPGRRNGTDVQRPPPLDISSRPSQSGESLPTPASGGGSKEHRGIFSRLKRKEKHHGISPDESSIDSPTSPVVMRNLISGDLSLDRPSPRLVDTDKVVARAGLAPYVDDTKKFLLVTVDGWTYRLVDVTRMDSATTLRQAITESLGLPQNSTDITLHLTSLGQSEHDEELSDDLLVAARRTMGDYLGTLKIYVNVPPESLPSSASAGLGLNITNIPSPSKLMSVTGKPLSESILARLRSEEPSVTSPVSSGELTLVAGKSDSLSKESPIELRKTDRSWDATATDRRIIHEVEEHRRDNERKQRAYFEQRKQRMQQHAPIPEARDSPSIIGNPVDFDAPRAHRRSKDFQPTRPPPAAPSDSNTLTKVNSLTKKNSGASRRMRSLTDANDLKRRSAEQRILEDGESSATRYSGNSASTNVDRDSASSTTIPSSSTSVYSTHQNGFEPTLRRAMATVDFKANSGRSSPGSPRSPGQFTMSKGNVPFIIPDYDPQGNEIPDDVNLNDGSTTGSNGRPTLRLQMPITNPTFARIKKDEPAALQVNGGGDISPHTPSNPIEQHLNRMSSRRSYGPNFDFKEAPVQWRTSTVPPRDEGLGDSPSDSDSDDSLFAKPIRGGANSRPSTSHSHQQRLPSDDGEESEERTLTKDERPNLSLKTSKVSFQTPDHQAQYSASTESEITDPHSSSASASRYNPESASSSNARSPDTADWDVRQERRKSFMSDVWANRPPAEGIVDHLDEFFPNVNLDQPVIEDEGYVSSPPMSPVREGGVGLGKKSSHEFGSGGCGATSGSSRSVTPSMGQSGSSEEENETLASDQSTLKAKTREAIASVAQRNIRRAGGLNRTRSIREVVQSNYQQPPYGGPMQLGMQGGGMGPARVPTIRQAAAAGGGIVRRKSTKMFGARIEQVKPKIGKPIHLETIPQDEIAMTSSRFDPRRQHTFKWIKGQLIGKGTFGRVYLGMNITTGEPIAVKQVEVNPKAAGQEKEKMREMVKSLDIEIDTMKDLDHPNIVSYLGCERKEFSISIFLEYIPGGSIGSCLRKHGQFVEPIVRSLTRQTLSGLSYLHDKGILHRDLKADNILLDLDGTCKISDFGISKKSDNIYGNDSSNSMQGSVFWMAPEVIRSQGKGYSAKVDVWSLGCVVLEMFAGHRPWGKEEMIGAIYKLGSLNEAPPIPEEVSSTISPVALSFMLDCFAM